MKLPLQAVYSPYFKAKLKETHLIISPYFLFQ